MRCSRGKPALFAFLMMLTTLLSSCAEVKLAENEKNVYTAVNIWYRHREKILSVNHHQGVILPVGTRVTIEAMTGRSIQFADQQGTKYRLILARKYKGPDMNTRGLFDQYFTQTDPMGKNGAFTKLNETEKGYVRSGHVSVGMSKEAVLMAYGYPPSHMTPTTDADVWKYWGTKFRAYLVYFKNNRVVEIQKSL